ncbi:MAG: oligosaccharide flippase family protein [Cetobacterium sp.]
MNFIRVIFGMLSPLIVMPYINRKFEPNLIGEIEYSTTIISYFILFAGLGISTYGVREIAKVRENLYERSKFVLEMSLIIFITNFISYTALVLVVYFGILKNINLKMLYLISLNICFTSFGFEWFYQGIEDQEYITKRSIFIKIISIILIFILIKEKKDTIKYLLILGGSLFFSNFLNIINLKKYISLNKNILKNIELKKHLRSLFLMFASSVAILIYSQIDMLMIGNISGTYYVGLYNISVKILTLGKVLITAVGSTLLPRLTNFYFSNEKEKYESHLKKSLQALILYSFYMILFIYINANEIVYVFGGKEFKKAAFTLQLQSIIIIISGLSYFYGVIVLYSQKKDKPFLYSVTIAALANILLNKILIPKYNQNGAVIGTIAAEFFVVLTIYILQKKEFKKINFMNLNTLKILVIGVFCLGLEKYLVSNFLNGKIISNLFLKNIIIYTVYTLSLILLKENFLMEFINIVKSKLK